MAQPPPPSVGRPATAAAILRAAQKDESFLKQLQATVADIVQATAGSVCWLQHHNTASVLTELLYCGLTTLSLRQTLGEEYTSLLQLTGHTLPSVVTRHAMVFLHCLGPPLLKYSLRRCRLSLMSEGGALQSYLRPELKSLFLRHVDTVHYVITLVQRAHLGLFYLQGAFYHFAKRLTGIRYVVLRRWLDDHSSSGSLRLLGWLVLLQLLLTLLRVIVNNRSTCRVNDDEDSSDTVQDHTSVTVELPLRCSLCLQQRSKPTACTCGHVFCWTCIHTCLHAAGPTCPTCRFPVEPHQLVPLINYT